VTAPRIGCRAPQPGQNAKAVSHAKPQEGQGQVVVMKTPDPDAAPVQARAPPERRAATRRRRVRAIGLKEAAMHDS
jgi:hypothetical protein